ncbi:MAG: hypothetical protein EXS05_00315 [Planctomycetaceae bacterium]|nr:hypothetical protein [Planctomycetaceae bacterium]
MFESPRSVALLKQVARRLHVAAIAGRVYWTFLVSCGLYAVALLVCRLCGIATEWVTLPTLLVVPAVAALVALAWHHRPSVLEAARVVDKHSGTKDLFLTVALIEKSAGEFQPLVTRAAEERAKRVKPAAVVPFEGGREFGQALLAGLLIAAGVLWLPTFDPFGKVEAAGQVSQRQKQLEQAKKATEEKIAQLKKEETEGPLSEETEKALENLKSALKKMSPREKSGNLKELLGQQKGIQDKWRKLSAEKLKDLLSQNPQGQQFGSLDKDKLEKWTRELQEGSTKSLQQELEELKDDLKRLAKTEDPIKRDELEKQVKKRMKDLSNFASEKVNSKPLAAALQRAMKQMEMAKMEGMDSDEALESAEKSLDLTKLELKELAQSAKDMKALEEALKVIQQAKQLNDKEKLDGEQAEGAQSMEDYAELYAELMAQLGLSGEEGEGEGEDGDEEGDGEGMGNRGMGRGGKAPEDDSVETGFKTEQSKSAVTAGKVLLSVKTKGLSDRGDAKKEYRELVNKVKEGYSEAILQEQVPPGYHDGIKSYFDNFDSSESGEQKGTGAANPADDGKADEK